jgi:hypothetical protein
MRQIARHGFFIALSFSTRNAIPIVSSLRQIHLYPMNHPELDEPVYWFVLLEKAVHRGDFAEAARAVRELKRLGIDVNYRRWPKREKQRDSAAN